MKIVSENRFSGKTYFYTIAPSRFDPRRDGRLHVGHRQRDGRRRRDLHVRAVQRQEPLGRRPRREREEGRTNKRCFADGEKFVWRRQ